jgi:NAD(P)H-dependent FMN reductase
MSKLSVIIGSTRPGRVGLPIGQWFFERALVHGKFEVQLVDLKEQNLPLLDEGKHPRLGQYEHEHTKAWSRIIAASDAFVFVTPEYNFSAPPALLNALDFLFHEWAYKPAGFVSYGGQSGGIRAVQMLKQTLLSMKVVGLTESVVIPFFSQFVEGPKFKANETHDKQAVTMLDELVRWTGALAALRR